MGGLFQLVRTLESMLPHQVVVGIVIAVLVLGAPGWYHNVKAKQIRGAVRRYAGAKGEAGRGAVEPEVFALADGNGRRMLVVAEEALRLNQKVLAERAIARLEALGTHPKEVAALRKALAPEAAPAAAHPLEAVIAVRRLLDEGLVERAREQLTLARSRFPDDPDLAALAQRAEAQQRNVAEGAAS
jgi:hypothetical protein